MFGVGVSWEERVRPRRWKGEEVGSGCAFSGGRPGCFVRDLRTFVRLGKKRGKGRGVAESSRGTRTCERRQSKRAQPELLAV